ncbi:MAG: hypothetical protein O3A20_11100 [Planctomycetota bacterium]|nr:hypothetical protein [Planctomycetota bacterium]
MEKAQRYRLLNEPMEAESICRDILRVDPKHREALITLLLALTDQFSDPLADKLGQAREVLERIEGAYDRAYYAGIVCERRGKTAMRGSGPHAGAFAYDFLRQAMDHYERAVAARPDEKHGDPVLRWNTCVRILKQRPEIRPAPDEPAQDMLE